MLHHTSKFSQTLAKVPKVPMKATIGRPSFGSQIPMKPLLKLALQLKRISHFSNISLLPFKIRRPFRLCC